MTTTITSLRAQVAALAAAAQPRRAHRRTTAEGRQELDRILELIADAPPPTPAQKAECAAVYAELDSILARLDPDGTEPKLLNPIAGISPAVNQPTER
jgi:hypothetical protein